MKISELIERLEYYKNRVGDANVWHSSYNSGQDYLANVDVDIECAYLVDGTMKNFIVIKGEE